MISYNLGDRVVVELVVVVYYSYLLSYSHWNHHRKLKTRHVVVKSARASGLAPLLLVLGLLLLNLGLR